MLELILKNGKLKTSEIYHVHLSIKFTLLKKEKLKMKKILTTLTIPE